MQKDLFSTIEPECEIEQMEKIIEVAVHSPALDLLQNIDVDNLSPRQALEQLYQLKALSQSNQAFEA